MTSADGGSPSPASVIRKLHAGADDRLPRATSRTENSVDAVVCGQLRIRSTRLRDG
jgi:hypothetical protein